MITLNDYVVVPTIFPDKTSQVWKLPRSAFPGHPNRKHEIIWEFENESELIHVLQLRTFLGGNCSLYMPFLPYGRQDKAITNESTFALITFGEVIAHFFQKENVTTLDAHSKNLGMLDFFTNISPDIKHAIRKTGSHIICFPDKGASERGYDIGPLPSFNLHKARDPLTGEINGLDCSLPLDLNNCKVLICDDICDGGRTFIEAAHLLYGMGAMEVNLYTTHGLYTKGIKVLFDAEIKRIFNYKGEVFNVY